MLQHGQGWSLTQIAEHVRRSPEAVAGLIKRGLKRLRLLGIVRLLPCCVNRRGSRMEQPLQHDEPPIRKAIARQALNH